MSVDLSGIVLTFIFIAPGFFFTRTYLAYRPRYYKEPNAFEQFTLFLIGSAFIHSSLLGTAAIVIFVHWLLSGQQWTVGQLLGLGVPLAQYPLPILGIYLSLGAGYILLCLIIARRTAIFLGQRPARSGPQWWTRVMGEDPPENLLLWYIILREEALAKGLIAPRIAARLNNGDHFEGNLNRLKLVGDQNNTIELAINNVAYRSGQQSETAPLTALPQRTILLKSTDILWLWRSDVP